MRRIIGAGLAAALTLGSALAQEFTALARLDPGQSQVRDLGEDILVTLYLSQPVPFRAFTLTDPPRLVLDFREVDWRGATREALLNSDKAVDLRFGGLRPGWSRMVVDLSGPFVIDRAGMEVSASDGTATLRAQLAPATPEAFAEASGAPPDPEWDAIAALTSTAPPEPQEARVTVVIDPGHGGIDPGAERGGLSEADLMLALALELSEAMTRAGLHPILSRTRDEFVPLAERMSIARAAGADFLISLHADALEIDEARGASVYTLSQAALDSASQRMAERHDRGDLLAGLDLTGQDDSVATALLDLARAETGPASLRLADALVEGLRGAEARVNRHPRREGPLAVLNAADFPSVLVEAGFLSNEVDRQALSSPEGRAPIVAGLVAGALAFAAGEEALRPLLRQ